jgi:hypothetical protein
MSTLLVIKSGPPGVLDAWTAVRMHAARSQVKMREAGIALRARVMVNTATGLAATEWELPRADKKHAKFVRAARNLVEYAASVGGDPPMDKDDDTVPSSALVANASRHLAEFRLALIAHAAARVTVGEMDAWVVALPAKVCEAVGRLVRVLAVVDFSGMGLAYLPSEELLFPVDGVARVQALNLSRNHLDSLNPHTLGVSPWSKLAKLDLRDNRELLHISPNAVSALTMPALVDLDVSGCTSLVALPSSLWDLQDLRTVAAKGCSSLATIGFEWGAPTDENNVAWLGVVDIFPDADSADLVAMDDGPGRVLLSAIQSATRPRARSLRSITAVKDLSDTAHENSALVAEYAELKAVRGSDVRFS